MFIGGIILTNEKLTKIFARSFYISFNSADSNIRKLIENSIDEETNTINLSKMVENRTSLKDANSLLYNFLSNTEVIQNAENFTELFKISDDCIYGYPQIYLEEYVDNKFINGFNNKIHYTYLKRNQKNSNPVTRNREKFNLVKDFLYSNNNWGNVDFSNISSRENLDSTTFDSPYRLYAKAVYSRIAIGYEKFKESLNKEIEDKVNKDWYLNEPINKQVQVNPYYALDYGTTLLIYTLFSEKHWNVYTKAKEEYTKTVQNKKQLPTNLRCVLANAELALETINYVLQKDSDSASYEPHSYSEIENYLKSEWCHKPKVENKVDLNNYETWGTVLPIDNNQVRALRCAFFNLSDDLRKKYSIKNDDKYTVSYIVEKLKSIYANGRKQEFDDYEKIQNIILEFEEKTETLSLGEEVENEDGNSGRTKGDLISDEDISDEYKKQGKAIKMDDKVLSRLIHSFKVTESKINAFFMFDLKYRAFLIQYIKKFGERYFVNAVSSRLCFIEDSENSNNRKNNENKVFNFWKRILKSILSPIYDVNPCLLINCFDKSANGRINTHENFEKYIYPQVKEINLNVIEKNILRGEGLNKTAYTGIFNNWFESIKEDIQKIFKKNKDKDNDVFKPVFDNVFAEFKVSTKYVNSIKAINLYELNKIIPIKNPFVKLIKDKNELLDFETIVIEIEKSVCEGMFEEQTFYNVAFELLKTGNEEKPAGDIWSNAYTQYKKSDGKLYSESEFKNVMNCITDLGQLATMKLLNKTAKDIYSKLESLIDIENKSKFMQDLRMLLSCTEAISDANKNNDLKSFYTRVLHLMKDLGYSFVLKYDNIPLDDDYELMSYDYITSLEKILNE